MIGITWRQRGDLAAAKFTSAKQSNQPRVRPDHPITPTWQQPAGVARTGDVAEDLSEPNASSRI
jgi:hypothetical protein